MDIFLIIGLVCAVCAASWAYISASIGIVTIAGFLGWSTFCAICLTKGKKKAFKLGLATNLSGVFWGFASIQLSIIISPYIGEKVAFVLTTGLSTLLMCYQGRLKPLGFIPGAFIGCSTYFATGLNLKSSIIGLAVGACIGYISETGIIFISSQVNKKGSTSENIENNKVKDDLAS